MQTLERIRERLRGPEPGEGDAPQVVQALEKPNLGPVPGRMMIRHRDGVSFVDIPDIAMVMRENRTTVLLMKDGTRFVVSDGMAELDERLPDEVFFRTHKSYIVNLNLIDAIAPYGRWTFIVKLKGLKEDALITHERFEELQKRFA